MTISLEKRVVGALIAVLAAFALFAAAAVEKAGATEVTPANDTGQAVLQPGELSWFIPANAFLPAAIGCQDSAADFDILPATVNPGAGLFAFNKNQPGTGTYSDDYGGVIMNVIGAPTFATCDVYPLTTTPPQPWNTITNPPPSPIISGVIVQAQSGWTVTANANNEKDPSVAIALPPSAVEVTIPTEEGDCVLDIAPDRAQAAYAKWVNGEDEEPSEMLVDSQIKFTEDPESEVDCGEHPGIPTFIPNRKDVSIAQFEADYHVTALNAGGPVLINP